MIVLVVWNAIVFLLYGIDKFKATHGRWRISESTLLVSAFCMGAFGAYLGMEVFRHKTKTKKFTILVPVALLLNVFIIGLIKKIGQ